MPPFHQLVFLALWSAVCGYAAVSGGPPERVTAAVFVAAVFFTNLSTFIRRATGGYYSSVEIGVALTDIGVFLALVLLTLFSTRYWPLLMTAIQGCDVLGHVAKLLGPDIVPKAYYAIVAFWSYPMLVLLALATWRHQSRLGRYCVDYPWVRTLPRRYRDGWFAEEPARPARPGVPAT